MAWGRRESPTSSDNEVATDPKTGHGTAYPVADEKTGDVYDQTIDPNGPHVTTTGHTELKRALKARHVTMIAIGGAIGTGLIIGTGAALAKSG